MALVEHLAPRHEIHVFAQQIDHQWPGVTYHQVSQVVRRPRWLNQLWYATATWWATRRGFDVVHSHENTWHGNVQTVHVLPVKYNLFHGQRGWSLGVRRLKVLTSPRLLTYLGLEQWRMSMAKPRAIVVTSRSLLGQIAHAYPACRTAVHVITPGVAQVTGLAGASCQVAARRCLGLPAQGPCVLFVANDYRKKGLATLINALTQTRDDSYLVVVGNTSQVAQFQGQAEAAGLSRRIYFLGSRKDMDDVYAAADCLAHPTREDTFAMVVLEAMAHGLPVLVSQQQYCGIAGLLTHECDALLLQDPSDAEALAQALNRLIDEPALRQRLSVAATEFARAYLWEALARQQEAIYAELCKPSR